MTYRPILLNLLMICVPVRVGWGRDELQLHLRLRAYIPVKNPRQSVM